jgi:DNA-binding response OmpR family regulator
MVRRSSERNVGFRIFYEMFCFLRTIMELTRVALLDLDEPLRLRTESALTDLGLKVYGCGDLASLYRVLDNEPIYVVLLRRAGHCPALVDVLLPELRASYSLSIVVESPDCSIDDRLRALDAGADLCLAHAYDPRELAALLCAQARRSALWGRCTANSIADADLAGRMLNAAVDTGDIGPAAPGSSPRAVSASSRYVSAAGPGTLIPTTPSLAVWQLLYQGWVLVTPEGNQLSLTGVERSFFLALAKDERHELSREALAREKFNLNFKSISVAISRLRKKVEKAGVRLPLHTVHGMGYVFIGRLSYETSPQRACLTK